MEDIVNFEELVKEEGLSEETQRAAKWVKCKNTKVKVFSKLAAFVLELPVDDCNYSDSSSEAP